MFDHFKDTMRLPDFTEHNWTSELRKYRGFPEYRADAAADFIYEDKYGRLTELFFGSVCVQRWYGHYPTYYMEVKATTGVVNEAFHMSPRQLDAVCLEALVTEASSSYCCLQARDMSREAEEGLSPPRRVYVLLRVWSVASEPRFRAYRDPWRLLCDGRMRHVSDVDLVIFP